jgi:pSer/pThr/pTyr-binding forkhead associated (FHA) protein
MIKKLLIPIVLVMIALIVGFVSAQSEGYRLNINHIDAAHFPEVAVNFQALDSGGQFVSGLTAFTVAENGQPVTAFDVRLDDAQAVTLVFVLDLGRYSGTTTISESALRQTLRQWIDGGYFRDGVDTVSIVVGGGSGYQQPTTIALAPTQSGADFRTAVDALNLESGQAPQSLTAVQEVITRISEIGVEPEAPVYVIYASRIVDGIVNSEAVTLAQNIGTQARELDVPIIVLHSDLDGSYAEPFRVLVSASGGQYLVYNRQQDTNQILTTLYGQLAASGRSYVATYRSTSGATGERTVTIGMQENAAQPASSNYVVNLAAPTVVITSPAVDFALVRTASEETAASETPEFDLNTSPVRFDVTWTDGLPRTLAPIELLANGVSVGTFTGIFPIVGTPAAEATPEVAAQSTVVPVTQTYEINWDLSTLVAEGSSVQSLEVRITDELGMQTTSAAIAGTITVDLPQVLPTIAIVAPVNNGTIERTALLDSAGAISGYGINEIPLLAHLVWSGETAGDIVSAEIVVDGVVVANFPYPTVTALEPEHTFSDQPVQAQATMELLWNIEDLTTVGPNLRDVAIQVRNVQGAVAVSAPITLNVQVSVPALQLPTVTVLLPTANANISRVAVPRAGNTPEFQDTGSYTVIAGILWNGDPKTLVIAELLFNGIPLGTEAYPSLLSGDEVGGQAANANPALRFFRVDWDISGFQTLGANLGQLQVRVRDVDGFEAISTPITVNVQVDVISPPLVTVLSPVNNTTITRTGQLDDSGALTFDVNSITVEAIVEWTPQLPFVLAGAELLANGTVVNSIPPIALDAANHSLVELPDGTRRLALQIPWDLSSIQTMGANLYQLQVRVNGASDIAAISAPINLNVQLNAPQVQPPLVSITSPDSEVMLQSSPISFTAEVLWSDGQARDLQFVELTIDGIVQQTLMYPQGTRFELIWDANNVPLGTSSHQISVRVRDVTGIESVSPSVTYNVNVPQSAAVVPDETTIAGEQVPTTENVAASVVPPPCPANLLEGWGNVDCLRERAITYLPWVAVVVMGVFLVMRTRATHLGGITRTLVGVGRRRRPLARLYVVQGPANKVGQNINVYTNITSIGRDTRLTDIQFYDVKDESSISTQHCTIRHVRGRFSLMDDNSTNGTQVNGLYVNEPVLLNDGDEITLGIPDRMGAVLRFHSQVTDMKAQETKTESPVPTKPDNGKSAAPVTPVRAQGSRSAKSLDMLDSILTEIEEKKNKPAKPNVSQSEETE